MTDDSNSEPSSLPPSAGAMLREAREKQGLHIAALATSIKVAPRKLDALENDRWSELPDATFTRALAQTVCRTLKIDAKPVLDLLPAQGGSTFDRRGAALNEPFRERMGRGDPALTGTAIRPMVWAAAGLMVAALALYFFPRSEGTGTSAGAGAGTGVASSSGAASAPAVAASAAALAASAAEIAVSPVALAASVSASATASATASAPATSTDTVAATAAALAAAPQLAPLVSSAAAEPVLATKSTGGSGASSTAADGTAAAAVTLSASRASWVDVRDARGQVLISRTLSAGETVGLEGPAPLRVAIGNAAAVQLVFRGQPFDVASRTRENVARFELQ